MPLTVTKPEAADRFPELIDGVATGGPPVVIKEEDGDVIAAIVPYRDYTEFLAARRDRPTDQNND